MLIYVKLFLTACFWGGTFVAGRALSGHVSPCSAAFLRFAVASACLFLLTWKMEGGLPPLKRRQILPVILLGLTGVFFYNILFFQGLQYISAGRAALIIAMNPIIITVCSALLFGERLTAIKSAGILLSVFGAMVVISKGDLVHALSVGIGAGEFFILGCVVSWVLFSLIGKTVLSGLSPLVSITYSSAIGSVILMIPAHMEGMVLHLTDYRFADWLTLFYLGIFGTVIGFIWYYQGIKTIGAGKASLFINFVPVSAIVLGFFILKEPITASLFVGALLVSTGVYLTNAEFNKKAVPVKA